ncbi:MAG TPA: translation elongation factor Ts [Saprospiraceae bacterium]|nr:elongation factor Ts [Saprospiraceae bacterium]MCB9328910.1 elongation factor Ts [Lewinellaceae bacterium]HPK10231.1 translation elongation factor Ts [Saprospiraceae bacterium]HPQ20553.1 translation elongation factor Ts [Saprospiraceae bacterium]HRX27978.1 translation elongation factor Ts [Saprospiraceae bacterium]
MSNISAKDVKELREQTGAGMMDCKKALEESGGDFEKAIELLRKQGQKLSAKRADREAKEGVVIAKTSHNKNNGVVVRLSCETDFVAKTDSFIAMAEHIADVALKNLPDTLDELLATKYDGNITIAEKIEEQTGVIGEKLELADYEKIVTKAGEGQVLPYIHMGYRSGVIVGLNLEGSEYEEAGKNVAMQVAAMNPVAVNQDGVDKSIVEKEIEIGMDIARQEGKPEAMLEKIAMGKLNKFFKENTLLAQAYVKDSKMSVEEYLKSLNKDLTVTGFRHVKLG